MTVVGTAYVEIKAMADKFGSSLHAGTTGPLNQVGTTAESSAGRGRKAFGLMASTIVQNSNGALGPLAEVADKITSITADMDEGHKSAGKWAMGIGAAATGAGSMLTMLGDKDKIAMQQLQSAVTNTGKSWGDYEGRMHEAADSGTKYGYSASQTASALNMLTISTHSPDAAMKSLQATMEVAQVRHMDLTSAARLVGRVYGGNTMLFRQFGIATSSLEQPVKDVATAQKAQTTAASANASAQANLKKVQAAVASGTLKGAAAHQALAIAQAKAKEAAGTLATANTNLTRAQKGTAGQAQIAQHNLHVLTGRIGGQADAAANTFTGHLHKMGAEVENVAAKWGGKLGPAITMAGPLLMGAGAIMETTSGIMGHFRKTQELTAATVESTDLAMEASNETLAVTEDTVAASGTAADLALAPFLLIGAAVIALGVGFYEAYKHIKPFHDAVDAVGRGIKTAVMAPIHAAEHVIHWFVDGVEHHGKTLMHDLKTWGPVALAVLAPFIGIPILIWQHWKQIKHYAEVVWHDVVHVWDILKQDTRKAWDWVWHNTVDRVKNMGRDVKRGVETLWHDVVRVWDSLKSDTHKAWKWVEDHTVGIAEKLPGKVWRKIDHGFHDAIHWLEGIGGDIMHGLFNGIENVAKNLPGEMKHIGKNLIEKPFKSVLSIFSPSGVFRLHGQAIPEGALLGIRDRRGLLEAEMADMARAVAAHADVPSVGHPIRHVRHPVAAANVVAGSTLVSQPDQVRALLDHMTSALSASGMGPGSQMPILYVAGDLVLRSKADVDALSRSLYVTAQNIERARG